MEVVRANGLEVAYERAGTGAPLVFAHGAASDSRLWRPQLAALADEFTVVAWDEPGAGRSDDVPAGFRLADYAGCLAALIEALGLGPAHVAGLSWGGTVVQELYRHHPGSVATLILVDTYAGWKGSLPEEELRARVAHARKAFAAPAEEFDPTLPGLLSADPPAEAVALLEEMAADVRPDSMKAQLAVMAEADQRDLLPGIAVPTLLIWGEQDARSPLGVARQLQEAIPDTKLVVIPDAGHVSNLEQPERFNQAVREFCRAHSPRAVKAAMWLDRSGMYEHGQANRFRRLVRVTAAWRPISMLYARTLHHIDRVVYRLTRGRATFVSWVAGLPIVMLTTTGAKSGRRYTLPLVAVPDDDRLVVIASNYGQYRNPSWYYNLRANPRATIVFEGRTREVVAHELDGQERERYYARGIEIYPGWTQYRERAAHRRIPVVELKPVE